MEQDSKPDPFNTEKSSLGNYFHQDETSKDGYNSERTIFTSLHPLSGANEQSYGGNRPETRQELVVVPDRLWHSYTGCVPIEQVHEKDQKGTSQGAKSPGGAYYVPMDPGKQKTLETILWGRGLFLLTSYPKKNDLPKFAANEGGIAQILACITGPYDPRSLLKERGRPFRWALVFVGGNGQILEWDEENGLNHYGMLEEVDIAEVAREVGVWLEPTGLESADEGSADERYL